MITIKTCLAAALGLVLLAGATTTASARSLEAQCDAYARNQAAPYGRGGNVVGGAILGAGTGAVLGGILDGRRGARKGAAIGAGAGALGGAAAQSRQWR
ncbi:MAG: hypothetical protein KDJ77_15210, partial [Rhodobiaceae bacterium]|nr:hypothetical protein [Rhodobiaceae bacterium]